MSKAMCIPLTARQISWRDNGTMANEAVSVDENEDHSLIVTIPRENTIIIVPVVAFTITLTLTLR